MMVIGGQEINNNKIKNLCSAQITFREQGDQKKIFVKYISGKRLVYIQTVKIFLRFKNMF